MRNFVAFSILTSGFQENRKIEISHCKQSLKAQQHVNITVFVGFHGRFLFQVQLYDPRTNGFAPSSPEIGMHVEIRDPDDKIILSKVEFFVHF